MMASKKQSSRIGEVLLLLLVFLLTTSVTAKRHLLAAPNGDIGVKGAKVDRQEAQDDPWGHGGWGGWGGGRGGYHPPSKTKLRLRERSFSKMVPKIIMSFYFNQV